jgi:hypothetical protein
MATAGGQGKVGFIGLGQMGARMAKNLLSKVRTLCTAGGCLAGERSLGLREKRCIWACPIPHSNGPSPLNWPAPAMLTFISLTASLYPHGIGGRGLKAPSVLGVNWQSGRPVVVYDVVADSVKELTALGAAAASSLDELARQADVIITMLPATQHVKTVVEGHLLPNVK